MGTLIAGEGGSVLVAARRREERPGALGLEGLEGPRTAPGGVPAGPASAPPSEDVDRVDLLPCEPATEEGVRAWAEERGLGVETALPEVVDPPDGVRCVAVSAASTGSGKSAVTRRVARTLSRFGVGTAVVRDPVANVLGWEGREEVEILREPDDLLRIPRPLCEQEELVPALSAGVPVVTGLDPDGALAAAAEAAGPGGVVVWDGGGAARPWIRPDLHVLVVDLVRPPSPALAERVREADAVILAKGQSAPAERARGTEDRVREWNPDAAVVLADLPIAVPESRRLIDRRAVVVEDWASLVLGGLKAGAGAVAARRFRCGVVDPRPFAVGAVAETLDAHPHIGAVVPALGRTPGEVRDLRETIRAMPGDVVLWASFASHLDVAEAQRRPVVRIVPELMEVAGGTISGLLEPLLPRG